MNCFNEIPNVVIFVLVLVNLNEPPWSKTLKVITQVCPLAFRVKGHHFYKDTKSVNINVHTIVPMDLGKVDGPSELLDES